MDEMYQNILAIKARVILEEIKYDKGVTELELKMARTEYKIERDNLVRLGVDVQGLNLPRTIKEKFLKYILI
jgi:hypothetical protein